MNINIVNRNYFKQLYQVYRNVYLTETTNTSLSASALRSGSLCCSRFFCYSPESERSSRGTTMTTRTALAFVAMLRQPVRGGRQSSAALPLPLRNLAQHRNWNRNASIEEKVVASAYATLRSLHPTVAVAALLRCCAPPGWYRCSLARQPALPLQPEAANPTTEAFNFIEKLANVLEDLYYNNEFVVCNLTNEFGILINNIIEIFQV